MKKILLLFYSLLFCCIVEAQNLVPNPSFEDTVQCPDMPQPTIDYALYWSSYGGTSDYYNSCASSPLWGVPNNFPGYQNPFIGNAYSGCVTWGVSPNVREYMGVQLLSALGIGTKYYVSFYVSNADSATFTGNYNSSSNNIGIRFSTIPYSETNGPSLSNISQIHASSIITDKINWTRINGSFISDSTYQYLVIGNFYDDANTLVDTMPPFNNTYSYYYVDAVCITTDSLYDVTWVDIKETQTPTSQIRIFPNPLHSAFTIHCPLSTVNSQLTIFNSIGEKIYQAVINNQSTIINLNAPAGIYFLQTEVGVQKLILY